MPGRGLRYLIRRTGTWMGTGAEIGAFVKAGRDARRPDASLQFSPFSIMPGTVDSEWEPRLHCGTQLLRPETADRKRGFELVTVSYDKAEDRQKLEKYIKESRVAWPVYFDGKAAKNDFSPKINASGVPRLYIFDQKGILQTTLTGSPIARVTADFPQNQLEGKVKQLLGIGEKGKK